MNRKSSVIFLIASCVAFILVFPGALVWLRLPAGTVQNISIIVPEGARVFPGTYSNVPPEAQVVLSAGGKVLLYHDFYAIEVWVGDQKGQHWELQKYPHDPFPWYQDVGKISFSGSTITIYSRGNPIIGVIFVTVLFVLGAVAVICAMDLISDGRVLPQKA